MVQFTWIAYVDVFRSLGSVLTVNAGFAVNVLTCARARAIPPLDDDPDPELLPAELLPAELLLLQPAARVATTTTAAATPAARFQLILNLHRSVSSDPDRGPAPTRRPTTTSSSPRPGRPSHLPRNTTRDLRRGPRSGLLELSGAHHPQAAAQAAIVRLQEESGYVTFDDEHHGRSEAIRPLAAGLIGTGLSPCLLTQGRYGPATDEASIAQPRRSATSARQPRHDRV